MCDSSSILRIVKDVEPDELYNLAAQSHVGTSFEAEEYTGEVDAIGVLRILEAVHIMGFEKKTRIYQASTSSKQKITVEVEQARFRPIDTPLVCCDNSYIKKELGWEPRYDIKDTLREMFESYLQRGKTC